jgi:two-component system response regulator NreC
MILCPDDSVRADAARNDTTMMASIKVHITDDHGVFRAGLRAFIEQEPDIEVVSEASSGEETLAEVERSRPSVVVLDINMPGLPAATVAKRLLDQNPRLAILVLTIHDEEHYLREFLRLGAKGFMVKTSTGTELIQAIRKVANGEQYVDPAMARYLIANYIGRTPHARDGVEALTGREREVCSYLVAGYTNAEVADALSISKRTVETHRAAIMAKIGLRSRAELVQFALENGLWSVPERRR